jgi:hypothetical protein
MEQRPAWASPVNPQPFGKRRCRMYGGARDSGAPHANRNAFRHGLYTQETKQTLCKIKIFLRNQKKLYEISAKVNNICSVFCLVTVILHFAYAINHY